MATEWKLSASPANVLEGGIVDLKTILLEDNTAEIQVPPQAQVNYTYTITNEDNQSQKVIKVIKGGRQQQDFPTSGLVAGIYTAGVKVDICTWPDGVAKPTVSEGGDDLATKFKVVAGHVQAAVTMQRTGTFPTDDQALWVAIRNRTSALDFTRYQTFIDKIFNCTNAELDVDHLGEGLSDMGMSQAGQHLSIHGPYAYALLKLATQVFLTLQCGVIILDKQNGNTLFDIDQERIRLNDPFVSLDGLKDRLGQYLAPFVDNQLVLPYLDRILQAMAGLDPKKTKEVLPYCYGILQHRMTCPSLQELIWSYWHEEGMLVQTMNAIAFRFQNRRSGLRDPLGELELDPLRPLNNLIWGLIQDEHNRLTVSRRAYEYDHHYGLQLIGKAVPSLASADSRSKFIEAFHNLLYRTAVFYREDSDTTVIADAFPLLNALKEVHLLLAEGAHNQFGDLPWTARAEMLTMQWLLARPEMREFLRGRYMVPYQEPWMGAVDSMKKLQGWTDTTITHFHELGVTGERILLSVRYGNWGNRENIQEQAKNWARYWKPDIQLYMHDFNAATRVDLMSEITDSREAAQRFLQPSMLLQRRLSERQAPRALPAARVVGALTSDTRDYAKLPVPRRG